MLQCGLLVPLHDSSRMGVFERLFIDIGDEQSIENDLSTYSSHLLNMKFFIRNSNTKTLLLIDEFGTGTEPMLVVQLPRLRSNVLIVTVLLGGDYHTLYKSEIIC
jgi:dsDNA-specific endonuclease/ATPase MutS2